MGWASSALLAVLLGAVLLSAGIEDARRREIADWKTGGIALAAPLWWWANGLHLWPDVPVQIGFGLVIFALFCVAFKLGMMGGGDVKLIAALALWFPAAPFTSLLLVMSLVGGGVTIVMMIERAVRRSADAKIEIPYGVAIAIAGLIALREPIFNQIT